MRRARFLSASLAVAVAALPATSDALAPAVLFMVKQIVQQTATSMLKDALLSSLSGMGCKGIALSSAIQAVDLRQGGGAALARMAMPNMPSPMSSPLLMPSLSPEMTAALAARMTGLGQMPPGMSIGPEQAAMMARMQQAMSQPLSAPETVAVIDELFDLGFLPKPIQAELKECMVLVPASVPALGMAMGMMKPIVPQLRRARDELHALSPAEQDDVAAAFVEETRALSRDERAAFVEHLDSGFLPPRMAAAVKRSLTSP